MTPPTIVLLVRHALTPTTGAILPGRAQGLHLSDEGRRQADAVARRLAALPKLAAIYASPLERARETAAADARARGLALRIRRGPTQLGVGSWTRRPLTRGAPPLPPHRDRAGLDHRDRVPAGGPPGPHDQLDGRRPRRARRVKSPSFDFEAPDHFTAGAVGQPGERIFYLQSGEARQVVTLKCEKEHIGALADYLSGLLTQLGGSGTEALPEAAL